MRNILHYGLLLSTLVLITAFGCKTPEPVKEIVYQDRVKEVVKEVPVAGDKETLMPLTPAILQRLRDSRDELGIDERIKLYQFRLVGRITLETEKTDKNDRYLGAGTAGFENVHIRESVTISDQTDGQAMSMRATRNETTLHLCFENEEKYQLVFYASGDDPDGFFFLEYTPADGRGDEKGSLSYGGNPYKVKFGDGRPYILIKLSQKDSDQVNLRIAPGRKVE